MIPYVPWAREEEPNAAPTGQIFRFQPPRRASSQQPAPAIIVYSVTVSVRLGEEIMEGITYCCARQQVYTKYNPLVFSCVVLGCRPQAGPNRAKLPR